MGFDESEDEWKTKQGLRNAPDILAEWEMKIKSNTTKPRGKLAAKSPHLASKAGAQLTSSDQHEASTDISAPRTLNSTKNIHALDLQSGICATAKDHHARRSGRLANQPVRRWTHLRGK